MELKGFHPMSVLHLLNIHTSLDFIVSIYSKTQMNLYVFVPNYLINDFVTFIIYHQSLKYSDYQFFSFTMNQAYLFFEDSTVSLVLK